MLVDYLKFSVFKINISLFNSHINIEKTALKLH